MAHRVTLNDPGVMEQILKDVETRSREYWLEAVARYNDDNFEDITGPELEFREPYQSISLQAAPIRAARAKRRTPKHQQAA